jgi:phosphohistidine swiveling domain-containing protein
MTLSRHQMFEAQKPIYGETDEVALVEPGANEAEATALTITIDAEAADWTYSATAEDNGTAGIVDAQPGVIYNGPNGGYAQVRVTNYDTLEHAITLPEATDTAALAVFKNSEVVAYGDEGFNTHAAEIAVENNVNTYVGPLKTGDVIRVGMVYAGEEADADLDLAAGELFIS